MDTEGSGFDFGVGFDRGELSAWLNYVPSITNTVGGADTEADAAMNLLGLTYEMSDYDLFAEYDQSDDDNSSITLGAARVHDVDGGFHFQELSLNQTKAGDDSDMDLSVAFGIEHKGSFVVNMEILTKTITSSNGGLRNFHKGYTTWCWCKLNNG